MEKLKKKILNVSKEIAYLQKDKKNTMQGYTYLSEAKVKEELKSAFEKNGIIFNYSTDSVREYEISPTSKGTKQFCIVANGTYSFLDTESDEKISGNWAGSGTDTGDKGLYKAITGGIKYVLTTNFLLPTGDDPENEQEEKHEVKQETKTFKSEAKRADLPSKNSMERISEKERENLCDYWRNIGVSDNDMKEYLKSQFKIESTKDILRNQLEEITNWINSHPKF